MRTAEAALVEQVAQARHQHEHDCGERQPHLDLRPSGHVLARFRAFDALGSHVEDPGEDHRDRETDQQEDDDERHRPFRNAQCGQDDRRGLGHGPGDGEVGNCHPAHASPLQFREESHRISALAG